MTLEPHLVTAAAKADVLVEALPYLKAFQGKIFVIKYGGSALSDPALRHDVLQDILFLSVVGIRPVLVHGGGADISQRMTALGQQARFVEGLRVTDAATLAVVASALEELNHQLVMELKALGGRAVGFAGPDATLLEAKQLAIRGQDLGYVGDIVACHADQLSADVRERGGIPIVWPLGKGRDGQLYNVNADQAAAEIAGALKAEKLVLVTDVRGILRRRDDGESLMPSVTDHEVETLIAHHVIAEGMIPKARACVRALRAGVCKTHMIDIKVPHGLLLEIFTDRGIGTEITKVG